MLHANTDKHEFYRKVETLVENLKMNDISISYGILWKEQCDNLELMLNEADKLMYENKKEFYSNSKYDRRKAEENKEKFYFIPIGIFTKSFCGFH